MVHNLHHRHHESMHLNRTPYTNQERAVLFRNHTERGLLFERGLYSREVTNCTSTIDGIEFQLSHGRERADFGALTSENRTFPLHSTCTRLSVRNFSSVCSHSQVFTATHQASSVSWHWRKTSCQPTKQINKHIHTYTTSRTPHPRMRKIATTFWRGKQTRQWHKNIATRGVFHDSLIVTVV